MYGVRVFLLLFQGSVHGTDPVAIELHILSTADHTVRL